MKGLPVVSATLLGENPADEDVVLPTTVLAECFGSTEREIGTVRGIYSGFLNEGTAR